MWSPLVLRLLDLIMWFVDKWAETEATKAKWKAAVDAAREQYRQNGTYDIPAMKREYDQLQKDLRAGKWKV